MDLFPFCLRVAAFGAEPGERTGLVVSRTRTVLDLRALVSQMLSISASDRRVWVVDEVEGEAGAGEGGKRYRLVPEADLGCELEEAEIVDGHLIEVEARKADGTWPSESASAGGSDAAGGSGLGAMVPPRNGRVGLANLGNTCFMNSALQCLSNTEPLRDFFLSGAFFPEINPDNPIGQQGKLALEYARLTERMWKGSDAVVIPSRFRHTLGRFAPRFSSFQQQVQRKDGGRIFSW